MDRAPKAAAQLVQQRRRPHLRRRGGWLPDCMVMAVKVGALEHRLALLAGEAIAPVVLHPAAVVVGAFAAASAAAAVAVAVAAAAAVAVAAAAAAMAMTAATAAAAAAAVAAAAAAAVAAAAFPAATL